MISGQLMGSSSHGDQVPLLPEVQTGPANLTTSSTLSTTPSRSTIKRKPFTAAARSTPQHTAPGLVLESRHSFGDHEATDLQLGGASKQVEVAQTKPSRERSDSCDSLYSPPGTPSPSLDEFPRPPTAELRRGQDGSEIARLGELDMGLRPGEKPPPPLRVDSMNSIRSNDSTKKQSPGIKFTSFFMRKPVASPGGESAVTDISEGRSPLPSPYPRSNHSSQDSATRSYFGREAQHVSSQASQDSINFSHSAPALRRTDDVHSRNAALEAELKEISIELANSIRRELDLEEIVDRLRSENPYPDYAVDRTSDYYSDSGTGSHRAHASEYSTKDDLERMKREGEQQRAQLRQELTQKWQGEISQRKAMEAHIQMLEGRIAHYRSNDTSSSDASTRVKELEIAHNDARRRLDEERQIKENFEDLLTGLRVELEAHRSERDNLRDEVVPQLQSRVNGLEAEVNAHTKGPYDIAKLQQEVQHLRDENAALHSAREMERGMNRGSLQFIGEDDDFTTAKSPRMGSLSRSNTMGRNNRGSGLARSGSLKRVDSTARTPMPETIGDAIEKLKACEQQRDALHNAVRYMRLRQQQETTIHTKRVRILQSEAQKAGDTTVRQRKGGYEREVRVLRAEINTLRKRADDALEQKWQCEKNLAGVAMDLNRNKQETETLQKMLQSKGSDPDAQGLLSTSLESAIIDLQQERARMQENASKIAQEEHLSAQLEESLNRSDSLSTQVRKQIQTNSSLRTRLKAAVENGEANQAASAQQVNSLQLRLKRLEDGITAAQTASETSVMKHEEEVRNLKASHNAQLTRALTAHTNKSTATAAALLHTPITNITNSGTSKSQPLSPMFANSKKSPRLDMTTSGPGMALQDALKTEYLEGKVSDLEKALNEAEKEMSQVIAKMSAAQMSVAELQAERDEATRQTRRLEAAVQEERQRYQELVRGIDEW